MGKDWFFDPFATEKPLPSVILGFQMLPKLNVREIVKLSLGSAEGEGSRLILLLTSERPMGDEFTVLFNPPKSLVGKIKRAEEAKKKKK